jgi:hypothetical protein
MNLLIVTEKVFAFQGAHMVTMDTRLLVLVTKNQRKELFNRAKKEKTTVSKLVRTAVDQYFDKECPAPK